MARPTLNNHEKRGVQLPTIRVTAAERVLIEDKAASAELTITDFVRGMALLGEVKPRKTKLETSFLVELNRSGNNLNQLARAANIGRTDQALIHTAIEAHLRLIAKLEDMM